MRDMSRLMSTPNEMNAVRNARIEDLPAIMAVLDEGRSIMRADGNMSQWGGGYPQENVILSDIARNSAYVVESSGIVVGYFAFILGKDPTYGYIEDGEWLDDEHPYGTIHRLAKLKSATGVAGTCFDWCWSRIRNLRADTHEDNRIMRHCLEKAGFVHCGTIYVADGTPRRAYQKRG